MLSPSPALIKYILEQKSIISHTHKKPNGCNILEEKNFKPIEWIYLSFKKRYTDIGMQQEKEEN